jgi:hypothetical protein
LVGLNFAWERIEQEDFMPSRYPVPTLSTIHTLLIGCLSLSACGGSGEESAVPPESGSSYSNGGSGGGGSASGGTSGSAAAAGNSSGGAPLGSAGSAPNSEQEVCTPEGENAVDEDGDGKVDEDCACPEGTTQQCCTTGIQICVSEGGEMMTSHWDECLGGTIEPEICEDGIDQDCDGVDDDCPDVTVACNTSPHETTTLDVEFPGSGAACPWEQGTSGGHHASHIEHVRAMELPAGAIICGLEFNVPQTGMYYDDVLLLTFNDAILIAAMNVDSVFPNQGGLFMYDWSYLSMQPFEYGLYCLGGTGSCSLPESQNQGTMSLDLPQPIVHLLSQDALTNHAFDFKVIVTGDDNLDVDCAYSAFTLEVDVEYVIP